jgi:hypothetical protein
MKTKKELIQRARQIRTDLAVLRNDCNDVLENSRWSVHLGWCLDESNCWMKNFEKWLGDGPESYPFCAPSE